MSRSTNDNLSNPAVKFLSWNSTEKAFQYYDKDVYDDDKEKQGKNVNLPHPFSFYVLDELFCIKGYNEKKSAGIFSNEVRRNSDKIVIRSKAGKEMEGTYGTKESPDIRDRMDSIGGKYTKSVYIAMLDDNDEYKIFNLQLSGSGFEGWLEMTKANRNYTTDEITFSGDTLGRKKGRNKYNIPVFSSSKATESGNTAALQLDKDLQEYLEKYMAKTQGAASAEDTDVPETKKSSKPAPAAAKSSKSSKAAVQDDDDEDEDDGYEESNVDDDDY